MDLSQTLFLMHITDGYTFRNTIGAIKSEIDYATMIISPKVIEISFINTSKCAIHKITINTSELTMYRYNVRDPEGNLYPEYPIAFETAEIFNTTKGIGRRDAIRLYWLKGDNKINIQPIKTSTKDPGRAGALFVNIINIEHKRYGINEDYSPEPNIRVQSKEFSDICGQVSLLKCSSLEIVGHNNAVTLRGILPNNTVACVNRFVSQTDIPVTDGQSSHTISNSEEVERIMDNLKSMEIPSDFKCNISLNVMKKEDLMTIRVPISTVKALSKIHNISPIGTLIRFYFAENKPTKIESPIGTYGLYTICLRNPQSYHVNN